MNQELKLLLKCPKKKKVGAEDEKWLIVKMPKSCVCVCVGGGGGGGGWSDRWMRTKN